jgi:hypothetical protein
MRGMPTVIYFIGSRGDQPLTLNVEEDPDQVMYAMNASADRPIPLERKGGGKVYVQPATIAYWRQPGRASVQSS